MLRFLKYLTFDSFSSSKPPKWHSTNGQNYSYKLDRIKSIFHYFHNIHKNTTMTTLTPRRSTLFWELIWTLNAANSSSSTFWLSKRTVLGNRVAVWVSFMTVLSFESNNSPYSSSSESGRLPPPLPLALSLIQLSLLYCCCWSWYCRWCCFPCRWYRRCFRCRCCITAAEAGTVAHPAVAAILPLLLLALSLMPLPLLLLLYYRCCFRCRCHVTWLVGCFIVFLVGFRGVLVSSWAVSHQKISFVGTVGTPVSHFFEWLCLVFCGSSTGIILWSSGAGSGRLLSGSNQ